MKSLLRSRETGPRAVWRSHFSRWVLRSKSFVSLGNEMSAEDTSLRTLRAFLRDDGIAESDDDTLHYGSVGRPLNVREERHFHVALRFLYSRGDVVMSFWISVVVCARPVLQATSHLLQFSSSAPQTSRSQDKSTHVHIIMLTLAFLGHLTLLKNQGAQSEPKASVPCAKGVKRKSHGPRSPSLSLFPACSLSWDGNAPCTAPQNLQHTSRRHWRQRIPRKGRRRTCEREYEESYRSETRETCGRQR